MNTTTDVTGATVIAGDYVAHATSSSEQKIFRIRYIYDNGVCDVFDPKSGQPTQIGCLPTRGVKLVSYIPK